MTRKFIVETLGWYGVAAILGAYAMLSFGMTEPGSMLYLFLNATGAIGIVIDAWHARNWQPVVLNVVWFAIAMIGLVQVLVQ